MKIKTVFNQSAAAFDDEVNAALGEGYQLVRRLSDQPEGFIAELVLLDPPDADPEPELMDAQVVAAVRTIKAYCDTVTGEDCLGNRCPLAPLCDQLKEGKRPDEWKLPEEV